MNCSAVGIIMRKLSNLEKGAQRRIEADERQIDPIDLYTAALALRDTMRGFNNVCVLASSEASSEDDESNGDESDVDVGKVGM